MPAFPGAPGYYEQASQISGQNLDGLQRGALQGNMDATARMGAVGGRVSEALNSGTMGDMGALRSLTSRQITAGAAQQDLQGRQINAQQAFTGEQQAMDRAYDLQLTQMSIDKMRRDRAEAEELAKRKQMYGMIGGAIQTGATVIGGIYGGPAGAAGGNALGGMANQALVGQA